MNYKFNLKLKNIAVDKKDFDQLQNHILEELMVLF